MADIRIIEDKEVFWSTTTEYTLEVDGETVVCRVAENPNGVEFFEFTSSGSWEESDTNSGIMKIIYDAWELGELS